MFQAITDIYIDSLAEVIESFEPDNTNIRNCIDQNKLSQVKIEKFEDVQSQTEYKANKLTELLNLYKPKDQTITIDDTHTDRGGEKTKDESKSRKGLIVPCILNRDFNALPYAFLIILNRFWDNLFKRNFLNERLRIRNMLALQEVLY